MNDAGILLNADLVGSPAEKRPVVLLHRGRVVEHGGRALTLDGVEGKRLALRRPVESPCKVDLVDRRATQHVTAQLSASLLKMAGGGGEFQFTAKMNIFRHGEGSDGKGDERGAGQEEAGRGGKGGECSLRAMQGWVEGGPLSGVHG
ncbi:hypothetical protein E2C01_030306 [Portunus trituberculatus]|uniref:Uncharacterized protein n=1 Tax=Portunus trituberculatus TaxID=210409 RepID=A0A5B7EV04_PORTR|nr:hypothetical protein [Portunus trituberculatus]